MPRPAKFTEDQIFDAALELVAEGGPGAATIAAIAGRLGAPSGSLYHRFATRDLIVARLWIRTIRRFQQGFLAALGDDDLEAAARGAALHVVRWARTNLREAQVMLLYRREDLAARWPEELGDELATLNRDVERALGEHARRRYGDDRAEHVQRVAFALIDVPYAAGRRHLLAGNRPPSWVDELVVTACAAILDDNV